MNLKTRLPRQLDLASGQFIAADHHEHTTTAGMLAGLYADRDAWAALPPETPIYTVAILPAPQQEGELLAGVTHLHPGRVGREFYMTRGHVHQRREQAEYYIGLQGHGLLLLQQAGDCVLEHVFPGSVHYIPPFTAHRLINTGSSLLSALAVWPAVAGHDYQALQEQGFGVRVMADGDGWRAEVQHA
ncbi:glucose-6-phosphate isomerase [Chimaeribacter californicus]|uniref:glucose-6-phosphate isomerase n=1 Tax=Chimaeribacter californicus TaxID=2060067 RepID=A0A2N5E330_9GAMM|nr:glucose-6-phosphate isomerase family protein [Chimaeribacter californicus]PLR35105.1 glucose-6-phosphate isomerase [Chimaeribacter californicus]